ncbi:competence protein ComER [Paenibacillus phyllosphaerae]|uniref:Pyrroline-5-carboxylate reductase n=1 Tax=Paenibacillus phyllosphaerae TaxID=274593 RepID=A0A7W5AUC7_9BACL|nr:late competence protein ComER [Paenibacillus phyllosphaerae]MBB3108945.1 competence protein ComER [Paenibacillus phyllosphaerae]
MNVGFIGVGSMGSLLIDAFVASGALDPSQISAANRTFAKAVSLAVRHPGLNAVPSNAEAAAGRDLVFICVKPHEYKKVIDEIKGSLQPHQLVISITSPVLLAQLEDWLPCKVAKVIPSITNYMLCGATLCMFGSRLNAADRTRLLALLSHISDPLQIEESHTRIVSDLSSCGPAFMAFILQKFIDAAVEETGIGREEATAIASSMLRGTGHLLTDGGMSPEGLQTRVAVPGGITAKALALLSSELNGVFNAVIRTTHAKYQEDLTKVHDQLYGKEVNGT